MIQKNLSTLVINELTKEQYDREKSAGNLNEEALYMVPETREPSITIDSALSDTSMNPVQNKVVKAAIDAIPVGPTITYGTTDLVAGTSPLAEGTFYFVYE